MAVSIFGDVSRPWAFAPECEGPAIATATLSTDLRRVVQSGRNLIVSWSGPWTDRARLDVKSLLVGVYPAVLKVVLAAQLGENGEPWDVATATVTYANALEATSERPVFVTGGVPARVWALYAWLDGISVATQGDIYAALSVDRGGIGTPYIQRATGVAP